MTKPFKFQLRGVKRLHRFKGKALLADDTGLGKSFQSLLYAHESPEARPILVICPAFLKLNWEYEARHHFKMRAHILSGLKVPNRMPLVQAPIVIVNYEILKSWHEYLVKLNPGLVVIDEVQYIKNPKTKRAKFTKRIARKVKRRIGLSATPLEMRPIELFSILNILWPQEFPSYFQFGHRYCKPKRTPWGIQFRGAERTDELHQRLKDLGMIRRRKDQVLKDLPPKRRSVIPIELSNLKEYKEAERSFLTWLMKQRISASKLKKAMKAQAVVQMGYLKRLAARLKLETVCQWIDAFLETSEEKAIFYGVHKSVLNALKERYADKCIMINGEVPQSRRQALLNKFKNSKKCRLMFGQLQATGVGWSAKGCSTIGFIELGWKPGEHSQAEDRICGIGRGQKGIASLAYYFIAKDTIEEKLCKLLEKHQGTLDAILDGKPVVDFDLTKQLLDSYMRRAA